MQAAKILQQADGTKYSTGTVSGVASIPGAVTGLWLAAVVTFDSRDMSAAVVLQAGLHTITRVPVPARLGPLPLFPC
jgi:hypothetical protein